MHEGVDGGGTHEFPAEFFEVFCESHRGVRGRRRSGFSERGGIGLVLPKEGVQRAMFRDHVLGLAGVVDGGFDLAPVADYARIQ